MRRLLCLLLLLLVPVFVRAEGLKKSEVRQALEAAGKVLDDWHLAASEHDAERYFGHMTDEAEFVGLEEAQRWSKQALRDWTRSAFKDRQMWTFRSSERHMSISPAGDVAWFDELLDTPGMGTGRGTGVLVKQGEDWKISLYVLSLPIPSRAFAEVLEVIRVQKLLLEKEKSKVTKPVIVPDGK